MLNAAVTTPNITEARPGYLGAKGDLAVFIMGARTAAFSDWITGAGFRITVTGFRFTVASGRDGTAFFFTILGIT